MSVSVYLPYSIITKEGQRYHAQIQDFFLRGCRNFGTRERKNHQKKPQNVFKVWFNPKLEILK